MKSINQIFNNNKDLLTNESVMELIDYCKDLEDEVISNNQITSFENKLTELVKEIYSSVNEIIEEDDESKRFEEIERIDYEETMKNLKKYIEDFSRYNRFNLNLD